MPLEWIQKFGIISYWQWDVSLISSNNSSVEQVLISQSVVFAVVVSSIFRLTSLWSSNLIVFSALKFISVKGLHVKKNKHISLVKSSFCFFLQWCMFYSFFYTCSLHYMMLISLCFFMLHLAFHSCSFHYIVGNNKRTQHMPGRIVAVWSSFCHFGHKLKICVMVNTK